ncbi:MAG: hypothetical protein OXN80_04665 [bacterium]|nr:hypothetical protein [bacterium]
MKRHFQALFAGLGYQSFEVVIEGIPVGGVQFTGEVITVLGKDRSQHHDL